MRGKWAVGLVIVLLILFAVFLRSLIMRTLRDFPMGFGRIFDECPRCQQRFSISPGGETTCPGCEVRLAACGACGELLVDADIVHRDSSGKVWLCAKHHEEEVWEAACLKEFDQPEANTPPPQTKRAQAARQHYEARIRAVLQRDESVDEVVFTEATDISPHRPNTVPLPESVQEAYRFYDRGVMQRDFGGVRVHGWTVDGAKLYVVRCTTDGSDGWVELYDADGTALGYARTDWDWPAWKARGPVRRCVFDGEVDPELSAEVKRLFGR